MDAPGNDGNVSMPEQVKRPNPWRKMMMMMMMSFEVSHPRYVHSIIKYIVDIQSEHNYINNKWYIKYQLHVSAETCS